MKNPRSASCRVRVVALIALLLAPVPMAGCDLFKTTKYNGQPMTADEVALQSRIDAEAEKSKAKADADRAAAALRAEADQRASEQARRKAQFDEAIAKLDAETRIHLASLQAEYEVQTAESARAMARMQADTEAAMRRVEDRTAAALADIDRRAASASSDIESKAAFGDLISGAITQGSAAGGPIGLLLSSVASAAIAFGAGRAGRQKAVDESWEHGVKTASEAASKADAAWDAAHAATIANLGISRLIAAAAPGPAPAPAPPSST